MLFLRKQKHNYIHLLLTEKLPNGGFFLFIRSTEPATPLHKPRRPDNKTNFKL